MVGLDEEATAQSRAALAGVEADRKGLERGDRILRINDQNVANLDDLSRAVEATYNRGDLVLVIARGGYGYTLTFSLD